MMRSREEKKGEKERFERGEGGAGRMKEHKKSELADADECFQNSLFDLCNATASHPTGLSSSQHNSNPAADTQIGGIIHCLFCFSVSILTAGKLLVAHASKQTNKEAYQTLSRRER